MEATPAYAIPLFGTVSVASFLGLMVLVLKLKDDLARNLKDVVLNSPEFEAKMEAHSTKLKTSIASTYTTKDEYRGHYTRLKHLEANCKACGENKLEETKFDGDHHV